MGLSISLKHIQYSFSSSASLQKAGKLSQARIPTEPISLQPSLCLEIRDGIGHCRLLILVHHSKHLDRLLIGIAPFGFISLPVSRLGALDEGYTDVGIRCSEFVAGINCKWDEYTIGQTDGRDRSIAYGSLGIRRILRIMQVRLWRTVVVR